jgi:hypothetical protein
LPPAENVPKKVFPVYPRGWYFIVNELNDPIIVKNLAQIETLDESRINWANFFSRGYLNRSMSLCLVWKALDQQYERRINDALLALNEYKVEDPSSYARNGPPFNSEKERDLYDYLAAHWKRCSLQMKSICEAQSIRYFHFFQPNQYHPGSKPMKNEELKKAFYGEHVYRRCVIVGYPIFEQHGRELKKLGVSFHDLAMVFANVEEPLYVDTCCHLNARGYEIIATKIGETIVQEFD